MKIRSQMVTARAPRMTSGRRVSPITPSHLSSRIHNFLFLFCHRFQYSFVGLCSFVLFGDIFAWLATRRCGSPVRTAHAEER